MMKHVFSFVSSSTLHPRYKLFGLSVNFSFKVRPLKKLWDYLGIGPNMGGGGFPIPKTLVFPKRALR